MISLEGMRFPQERALAVFGDGLVFRTDPQRIRKLVKKECRVGNDWMPQKAFFDWFIVGGDWHLDHGLVNEDRNYLEIRDLLMYEGDFQRSPAYRRCVQELEEGIPQKGVHGKLFASEEDIIETFRYYLALVASMKNNGYRAILETTKVTPERHIGVCIAPDGELFHFRTGHHRLAIAQQTGVSPVLVHVHCVHPLWVGAAMREHGGGEVEAIGAALAALSRG